MGLKESMSIFVRTGVFFLVIGSCLGQFNQRQSFSRNFQTRPASPNSFEQFEQPKQTFSVCPESNGRFPIPSQCDAYIECINGVATEKLCPDGLLFNPEARFNYPCGYPIDIKCEGRSALQQPQPSERCPHQYGYFKIGDRQNCGQFINCIDGKAHDFNCPEGLAYNPETYRCDWPDQVADCDAEAFLGFTCPAIPQTTFLNSEARFYRSPTDCQRYFICVEGRPRLQTCGAGNAFNDVTKTCEAAENVTGCEPPATVQRTPDYTPVELAPPAPTQQYYRNQQQQQFNNNNFQRTQRQRFVQTF